MTPRKKSLLLIGLMTLALVVLVITLLSSVYIGTVPAILLFIAILAMVVVSTHKISEWQHQDQMSLIEDALNARMLVLLTQSPPEPTLCPICRNLWDGVTALSRECDRIDCAQYVARCIPLSDYSISHVWLCASHHAERHAPVPMG